jgi:hypothetical protein
MTDGGADPRSVSCYTPLAGVPERQLQEFRLVTLLPDQFPDRIRCQLRVHSLDNPPPYETVSYAWGDPNDTKVIEINGVELVIPSSLEGCLKELRLQLQYPGDLPLLPLWTDAICIDQINLEERAVQVENMGTIYRRCSSMYIWLGPTNPSFVDRSPFEMISHFYNNKHFHELPGFTQNEKTGLWEFQDNPTYQEIYSLFHDSISRPWWERLWCVQEVALCPKAIVRMGLWWMPWSSWLEARENHSNHSGGCCKGLAESIPAKYAYFADPMLFLSTRSEATSIDDIIVSLRHKLCKDARDKVYGLLALLENGQALDLRPDYTMPVGDLYRQVTQVIITQSNGDLRYLTGSGFGSDSNQLPSWVRDFAAPLHPVRASNERNRFNKYSLYYASGEMKSKAKVMGEDTLCLSGTFVDYVGCMGASIDYRDWDHPQGVLHGVQAWAELAGVSALDSYCTPGSAQERFWRTITADSFVDDDEYVRIPTASHAALSSWFTTVKSSIDRGRDPLVTPYVFAFWSAVSGRNFFMTKSGHMGLCFPHARLGDEVWVLAGGKVPFVLRPLDEAADTAEAPTITRKLIGECYLDSYMDGEALQKEGATMVPIHLS